MIELTIHTIKYITKSFDDCFPYTKNKYELQHIIISNLFLSCYNKGNLSLPDGAVNLEKPIDENLVLLLLIFCIRNKASYEDITYGLYLSFLGLSYRNAAKAYHVELIKEEVTLPSGNGIEIQA